MAAEQKKAKKKQTKIYASGVDPNAEKKPSKVSKQPRISTPTPRKGQTSVFFLPLRSRSAAPHHLIHLIHTLYCTALLCTTLPWFFQVNPPGGDLPKKLKDYEKLGMVGETDKEVRGYSVAPSSTAPFRPVSVPVINGPLPMSVLITSTDSFHTC